MHTTREIFTAVCAKIHCCVSSCSDCSEYFGFTGRQCPYENIDYAEMDEFMLRIYEELLPKYDLKEEDVLRIFSAELEKAPVKTGTLERCDPSDLC